MIRLTVEDEGMYTVEIVKRLPKEGNYNRLYILQGDTVDAFYLYKPSGNYKKIRIASI